MEFFMVITISFMLLVPGLYMVMDYLNNSSLTIQAYQISQIGQLIVNNAEVVQGYGKDARLTARASFPDKVSNMYIVNNSMLIIETNLLNQNSSYFFVSDVNITAAFVPLDYVKGPKDFRIESKGDYVSIERI